MSDAKRGDKSYMVGKAKSEEIKKKISDATSGENHYMFGKKQPIVVCTHCGKSGGERAMKQWHFDNCKGK